MSDRDRYARSFGAVAEGYEANRPPYADAAVDWIAARLPLRDVVDVGAGTGKLTRQLVERGATVVAVEPDPEMRAVFARVVPGVPILDGRGEAIPVADGSADVITVGQAFHWFERRVALEEMHRALRPGGGVAFLWNRWNEDDPVLGRLNELLAGRRPTTDPWDDADRAGLFGAFEERLFSQVRTMTVDQLEGWAASTSGFVNASRDEQERIRRGIREIVGASADVAIATSVMVADRA
ncbi:MAG: class I SAM-dependent methyltransferase [Actinomycetota bacterium]